MAGQQEPQITFDDLPDQPELDFSDLPDQTDNKGVTSNFNTGASTSEPPEEKDRRSMFRRGWDTVSTPLIDVMSPQTPEMAQAQEAFRSQHPWAGRGMDMFGGLVSGMSSPVSLATMGVGGLEAGAAKLGLQGAEKALKWTGRGLGAGDVVAGAEDVGHGQIGTGLTEMGLGALTFIPRGGNAVRSQVGRRLGQVGDEANIVNQEIQSGRWPTSESAFARANEPIVDPNLKGGVGDPELAGSQPQAATSGVAVPPPWEHEPRWKELASRVVQARLKKGPPLTEAEKNEWRTLSDARRHAKEIADEAAAAPTPKPTPKLDKDLAGAKPRFYIGKQEFNPVFESDLDKALLIIAQTKPSKQDAKYLKFVMDHTGLDEAGARAAGQEVRRKIKEVLKASGDEKNPKIPTLHQLEDATAPVAPVAQAAAQGQPVMREAVDPATGRPIVPAGAAPAPVATGQIQVPPVVGTDAPTMSVQALRRANQIFNTLNEVIDAVQSRTDITPQQKATLIENIHKNQIEPNGTVPNNPSAIGRINNFAKSTLTSYDISAPGRQGLALWHTKAFWGSWMDMFKSWGSKRAYDNMKSAITERPLFQSKFDARGKRIPSDAERAGLSLPDVLGGREERFASGLAEKIPGIKASERAYTAFLNKLRADHFETLVKAAEDAGLNPHGNEKLMKDIAKFINTSTGRGDIGALAQAGGVTGAIRDSFFSPRFVKSRLDMINPMYYYRLEPFARKQALKSVVALATASAAMNTLYEASGADVKLNPFKNWGDTDLAKSKFGNTRMDPNAGVQQPLILVQRLMSDLGRTAQDIGAREFGIGKSPGPRAFGQRNSAEMIGEFAAQRLAPVQSFAVAMLKGTDFDYKPIEVKSAILKRFVPLLAQDIYDLAQDEPELIPFLIPGAALGQGMNTYSR